MLQFFDETKAGEFTLEDHCWNCILQLNTATLLHKHLSMWHRFNDLQSPMSWQTRIKIQVCTYTSKPPIILTVSCDGFNGQIHAHIAVLDKWIKARHGNEGGHAHSSWSVHTVRGVYDTACRFVGNWNLTGAGAWPPPPWRFHMVPAKAAIGRMCEEHFRVYVLARVCAMGAKIWLEDCVCCAHAFCLLTQEGDQFLLRFLRFSFARNPNCCGTHIGCLAGRFTRLALVDIFRSEKFTQVPSVVWSIPWYVLVASCRVLLSLPLSPHIIVFVLFASHFIVVFPVLIQIFCCDLVNSHCFIAKTRFLNTTWFLGLAQMFLWEVRRLGLTAQHCR